MCPSSQTTLRRGLGARQGPGAIFCAQTNLRPWRGTSARGQSWLSSRPPMAMSRAALKFATVPRVRRARRRSPLSNRSPAAVSGPAIGDPCYDCGGLARSCLRRGAAGGGQSPGSPDWAASTAMAASSAGSCARSFARPVARLLLAMRRMGSTGAKPVHDFQLRVRCLGVEVREAVHVRHDVEAVRAPAPRAPADACRSCRTARTRPPRGPLRRCRDCRAGQTRD